MLSMGSACSGIGWGETTPSALSQLFCCLIRVHWKKEFCPGIICLMSYGALVIEPERDSHSGNASWQAALCCATHMGLLHPCPLSPASTGILFFSFLTFLCTTSLLSAAPLSVLCTLSCITLKYKKLISCYG